MIAIRITLEDTDSKKYVDTINTLSYKSFLVIEYGKDNTNPHIQGIVEPVHTNSEKIKSRIDTFRRKVKAAHSDIVGNKRMSIKQCNDDIDNYIRYLCKGTKDKPPIIANNSWKVDTDKQYTKYWDINKTIKSRKLCKIDSIKATEVDLIPKMSYIEKIYLQIMRYHKDNNLLIPDKYMFQKYYETIVISELDTDADMLSHIRNNYLN